MIQMLCYFLEKANTKIFHETENCLFHRYFKVNASIILKVSFVRAHKHEESCGI